MNEIITTPAYPEEKLQLPFGWSWIKLSDLLVCMESGSRPKGGAVGIDSGVPSISAEHMTPHGIFDFSIKRFVPREYYENMLRGHIRQGDILIVKDGATTGKTCFVNESFPYQEAVINEHVFICRADSQRVLPELLFLWLWGPQGQYEIKSSYQGAAIGGINQSFAAQIQVPVPPLLEQERILTLMHELMAAVDKARLAAQARLEAVKALPTAFLHQVFPQPAQPLPASWRWVKVEDVANLLASKSIATDGDTEVEAITTACLSESGFSRSGTKSAKMWASNVEMCLVSKGEVLVARSNTPELVGRASLFDGVASELVASDLTIRVKTNHLILPEYLARYMSYLFVIGYWRDHAGGASGTMKKITRTQVMRLNIPLPSIQDQQRIAGLLKEQMTAAEKARLAAEAEVNTINALPAALLRRAFNGEI